MTLTELESILVSLDPSKDWVRLMGGEPTLHTQYPQVIQMVKERGFKVVVFTNGLHPVLRKTEPDLPDRVLVNLNDWSSYGTSQQDAIRKNLSALGDRAGLAYTILHPAFDLSMHRQLVMSAGLQPGIRLGLAQPILGGDNVYLKDADLQAAHQSVVRWAQRLSTDGIRLSLDCGFMRCQFTDDDIETLVRAGTVLNFDCSPILDVGPELQVWRCLAFSASPGVAWSAFEGLAQLNDWFAAREDEWDRDYGQCDVDARDWCRGGCLARRIIKKGDPSAKNENIKNKRMLEVNKYEQTKFKEECT